MSKRILTLSILWLALKAASVTPAYAQEGPEDMPPQDEEVSTESTTTEAVVMALEAVEKIDPHALPENIEEIPALAEKALENGNLVLAEKAFQAIKDTQPDLSAWGLARVATNRGQYAQAVRHLGDLPTRASDLQKKAADLHARLLLVQAEIALLQKKLPAAATLLADFERDYPSLAKIQWLERLKRQQKRLSGDVDGSDNKNPLRIGLLLPLSGNLETLGKDLERAALMGMFATPQHLIEVYPEDTQGTPEGANTALQRVLERGVDVIVGPLLASEVEAIGPYASAAGKPIIAFSSDRRVATRGVHLMSTIPTEQARLMARHGIEQGKRVFAALLPDNTYGREMLKAFTEELKKFPDAKLLSYVFYQPAAADLSGPLRQLVRMDESAAALKKEIDDLEKEHKQLAGAMSDEKLTRLKELKRAKPQPIVEYEALFVPAQAESMPLIASQLAFYDTDASSVMLLGSSLWDAPALLRNNGEYMRGARLPSGDHSGVKAFNTRFKSLYDADPHPLAPLAYDTIFLLADLMENGLQDGVALNDLLQREAGFRGVTGAYRFTKDGITSRAYNIMDVRGRSLRLLEEAPVLLPPQELNTDAAPARSSSGTQWRGFFDFGGMWR